MKQPLLTLLLVSFASLSALADSPEAILKDYRKQAAQVVERLNQSLEKAATPMITKLVASGDTAGAELLTAQLKEKLAGEPVPKPQASAVQLFTLYDEAFTKALAPVQKSSVARIDSLLKTAGGPKIETVTELGKVRAEIEAGKIVAFPTIPVEWTYHRSLESPSESDVFLEPNGKLTMINNAGEKKFGKWKPDKDPGNLIIRYEPTNSVWKVTIEGDHAVVIRSDLKEPRYFKVKK